MNRGQKGKPMMFRQGKKVFYAIVPMHFPSAIPGIELPKSLSSLNENGD